MKRTTNYTFSSLGIILFLTACGGQEGSNPPGGVDPTATPVPTPITTPTAAVTPVTEPTASVTATPKPVGTPKPIVTPSPVPTIVATPKPKRTMTPTPVPTVSATPVPPVEPSPPSVPTTSVQIIPSPKQLRYGNGVVEITANNRVVYSDPELKRLAEIHTKDIERIYGLSLSAPQQASSAADGDIFLTLSNNLEGEAYKITADSRVMIEAGNYDALAFAMMTNLQSMQAGSNGLNIPALSISDAPHRSFRAYQATIKVNGNTSQDNYYGIQELKKFIDILRFYKVRYFQVHDTESQWMFSTLNSSDTYSNAELKRLNLYSKSQWQELLQYGAERGVYLTPHSESTANFPGMHRALVEFGKTGKNWLDEIYRDESVQLTQGRDGKVDAQGTGVDTNDPDYKKAMEIFTRRAYRQYASVFNNKKLPYYHMGPVQGEGGTSPEEMQNILGYLRKEDSDVKLMFWGGPNPNDGYLQANKDSIIVETYSPKHYHEPMGNYIKAGITVVNAGWRPNYITPSVQTPLNELFDNANLYRSGAGGIVAPVEYYLANESDLAVGGLISSWDYSILQQGQLQEAMPRIAAWVERHWNYKPFAQYAADEFDKFLPRFNQVHELATRLVADPNPPSAPANLSASKEAYSNKICLVWPPSNNFPSGYNVYRASSDNFNRATRIADKHKMSDYCDEGVNGSHYYWVKAENHFGESAPSRMATGITGNKVKLPAAHEAFDYPLGASINGKSGGSGMKGAWSFRENYGKYTMVPGLSYGSLEVSGNALAMDILRESTNANDIQQKREFIVKREIDGKVDVPGTQLWYSMLFKVSRGGYGGGTFGLNATTGLRRVFNPSPKNPPGLIRLYLAGKESVTYPMDFEKEGVNKGATYFIVIRYDFSDRGDNAYLWVNPGKTTPSPLTATASLSAEGDVENRNISVDPNFNGFWMAPEGWGLGEFTVDELRVGATYKSVAPGLAE